MVIHALFGIICGYIVHNIFVNVNLGNLIFWGVSGSLLPDIDHFLYFYVYGRKDVYSKVVRAYIKDKNFRKLLLFWRFNHKKNGALYSHNILSLIIALYMFGYFVQIKDMPTLSVVALAWFSHYAFDIFEDFLFMKHLNPNWYLKFNKKATKKDLVIP